MDAPETPMPNENYDKSSNLKELLESKEYELMLDKDFYLLKMELYSNNLINLNIRQINNLSFYYYYKEYKYDKLLKILLLNSKYYDKISKIYEFLDNAIRNKYVKPGYMIPENSFFYQEAIAESSIADKTSFSDLPNDYTIYELKFGTNGFHETYGCSIMTGNYIDLYFQSQDTSDQTHPKLIFEKFITSIQVLKVIDKNGLDVFTESPDEEPKPTAMWFAVPTQFFELLRIAENLPGSKIIPVPRNAAYSTNPGDTEIANDAVEAFILQNASSKQ